MTPDVDKPKEKPLGLQLFDALLTDNLKDLIKEYAEIGLDGILEEGMVKSIPVINTIVTAGKSAGAIRDRLLLRKVTAFILNCPSFSKEEKESFLSRHFSDRDKAKKMGEQVVLILEKLDDLDKPEMISKVFAAL